MSIRIRFCRPQPQRLAAAVPCEGAGSEPAYPPCAVLAVYMAGLAALAPWPALAQGRADPAYASAPRPEPAATQAVEAARQNSLEERLQHGFFGDLSRPAPPAIHRIDGVRIPETQPAARPGQRAQDQ